MKIKNKNTKKGGSKKGGKSFAKSAFFASIFDLGIGLATNILNLMGISIGSINPKKDPIYLKPGNYDTITELY